MSSVAVLSPAVLPSFPAEPTETLEAKRARAVGALSSSVRAASALEVRPAPEMMLFGIASLDALTGGVPRGGLTELFGPASSGRTSVMLSLMASVTRRQEVCALIDVTGSFDPASAAAAGVDLKRLLWVRCGKSEQCTMDGGQKVTVRNARVKTATTSDVAPPAKNISWSIRENYDSRLRHAITGGCYEMARRDRSPLENASDSPRQGGRARIHPGVASSSMIQASASASAGGARFHSPARECRVDAPSHISSPAGTALSRNSKWTKLDQALKATDLLLQGGGFGLIVIDLGDISIEQARRIPLTSWFRFRRVVENTPTILLLVARDSCAKTCASLVLQLGAQPIKSGQRTVRGGQKPLVRKPVIPAAWPLDRTVHSPARECRVSPSSANSSSVGTSTTHINLLDGLDVTIELVRTRLERKPVRSVGAHIQTQTAWRQSG